MIIQHILFPDADICAEEELFLRKSEKTLCMPGILHFKELGFAEFNTYFNALSIGKWLKYTSIKNVSLKIKLEGSFIISICQRERYAYETAARTLVQYKIDCIEKKDKIFPVPVLEGNGLIYFTLQAISDGSEFYGGEWVAEFEEVQKVKLGIIFCTYKRDQYILRNLDHLKDYHVFVVDNAGTLPEGCCENLYRNRNLGGAGGFARGMYEISKLPEYTHVLLMDDDVVVHPESVYRAEILYITMKPEYRSHLIGGAMFRLDIKEYQFEAGGVAMRDETELTALKHGLRMHDPECCLMNEIEENCDFNAWFFCAFPIELCKGDQLPLPLFMQYDDVEFSLRHNKRFIHMNGICVWHEGFGTKIHFGGRMYYIHRNCLITIASHNMAFDPKQFMRATKSVILRELLCQRYLTAEHILDGILDFLKGIDWLKALDSENKQKDLVSNGYQVDYPEALGVAVSLKELESSVHLEGMSKRLRLLRAMTLNGLFMKADKVAIMHMERARPVHFYRASSAVYYDIETRKAFVTHRSRKETLRLLRKFYTVRRQFFKKYKKISAEYFARRGELMSVEFWEGQFDKAITNI